MSYISALFRFLCITVTGFGLLFALVACPIDTDKQQKADLDLARNAVRERDFGDAEMYYERYLRKNPLGQYRWEVWQSLLEIALDIRHDMHSGREYLEIMLMEFNADPERRREIQLKLADLADEMLAHERAVVLWEAVSTDPGTSQDTLAEVYCKLSKAYLRRLEFTLSKDLLDRCLQLNVAGGTKARCLYALAEAHTLTEELGSAEEVLRDLLDTGVPGESLRVEAVFMLADVLEQQDRIKEAEQLFESLREVYPNPRVIEVRLTALKNKRGANAQGK